MNYLQKKMAWIFGIFFLWMIVSVYWYVCGIRGFCSQKIQLKSGNEKNQIEEAVKTKEIKKTISFSNVNDRKIEEIKKDVKVIADNRENNADIIKTSKRTIRCYSYLNSYINENSNKNIPSEVKKLENFFNTYYKKDLTVDGIFGEKEIEAVKEFQKENNLEVDGQVGPATQQIINAIYCVKTEKKD